MNEKKKSSLPKVLGIGCVVLILLAGLGAGGCWWLINKGIQEAQKQEVPKITASLRAATGTRPNVIEIQSQLGKVDDLAKEGSMGLLGFGGLKGVYDQSMQDGSLSDEEVDELLQVVDKLVASGGDLTMQDLQDLGIQQP